MVYNELLMQFQADILNVPVVRPKVAETTCLGAAYAAGIASGFWSGREELYNNWEEDKRWIPDMAEDKRRALFAGWQKAVTGRLTGWNRQAGFEAINTNARSISAAGVFCTGENLEPLRNGLDLRRCRGISG
jgi:hypothetical protein